MEAPNPSKRLRRDHPCVPSSSAPSSLPTVPDLNQNHVDLLISSFLSLPDLPSLSSSLSISSSFDQAIEKLLESSGDESVQDRINDRGFKLASLLHESWKRCARKLANSHNSSSWPLPHDLTVTVFSMLDTKSLMRASACCIMFKKCAMDPLSYSHIDLTTGNAGTEIVRRMILNAGKELRSLKVGCPESSKSMLSGYCLAPLSYNRGFLGKLLRSLHLYDNRWLDINLLLCALSVCSNLTELKIVGLQFNSLDKVLDILTSECEHLFLEQQIGSGRLSFNFDTPLERKSPYLTSLSLIGFDLGDVKTYHLVKGLVTLKYLNISRTSHITGALLGDLSYDFRGSLLETLILRDCNSLEERNVCNLLDSLLLSRTNFRFIRHIDVSNDRGLSNSGRCKLKFPLEELREQRPGLAFVAYFRSPSPSSSSSSASSSSSSSSSPSSSSSSSSESEDE